MMPEKQRNLAVEGQNRLAQIQKHLEQLTPDELQTEFDSFFLDTADEDLDLELLDLYLKQLDRCSPMEPAPTAEESLHDFREKHGLLLESLESEPAPTKRRSIARMIVIAAAAALLMGLMIIQVSGVDWMGSFARWTSEMFGFSSRDYEVVTQWNPEYDGLRKALEEIGATENLAPKYLREGYQEVELHIDVVRQSIIATYANQDSSILFSASRVSGAEGISVEKNCEKPDIYIVGNIKHYIMNNMNTGMFTTVWEAGNFECAIYGVPTRDDLIRMIDSIYTEEENET